MKYLILVLFLTGCANAVINTPVGSFDLPKPKLILDKDLGN